MSLGGVEDLFKTILCLYYDESILVFLFLLLFSFKKEQGRWE